MQLKLDDAPYNRQLLEDRSEAVHADVEEVVPGNYDLMVPRIETGPSFVRVTEKCPSGLDRMCATAVSLGLHTEKEKWKMDKFLEVNGDFSALPVSCFCWWYCLIVVVLY